MEMGRDPAAAANSRDAVIAEEIAARGVAVGSVALVESSDGKVGFGSSFHKTEEIFLLQHLFLKALDF